MASEAGGIPVQPNRLIDGENPLRDKTIAAMLLVAGIIHLLPLSGVLGAERLTALYGLSFADPNLEILMRHRAVLFGLLGALLIYAIFQRALQPLALAAGLVSVITFILLAWSVGGYGPPIRTIIIADLVALVCLAVAAGLHLLPRTQ